MDNLVFDQARINALLKSDCSTCFGFCCAALFFTAMEGFPINKDAGVPCPHLADQFKCDIHTQLQKKGLKGCMAYDCFGAGQRVAQLTYKGKDWREQPKLKVPMFESFLTVHKLHEMLWYLNCVVLAKQDEVLVESAKEKLIQIDELANSKPEQLRDISLEVLRIEVNKLLAANSELVRAAYQKPETKKSKTKQPANGRKDFIGADLRKMDMRGADLRGALLIAANLSHLDLSGADFIAADLRDTNLCDSDLSSSINLTQIQISGAKGNHATKLPANLMRPIHW